MNTDTKQRSIQKFLVPSSFDRCPLWFLPLLHLVIETHCWRYVGCVPSTNSSRYRWPCHWISSFGLCLFVEQPVPTKCGSDWVHPTFAVGLCWYLPKWKLGSKQLWRSHSWSKDVQLFPRGHCKARNVRGRAIVFSVNCMSWGSFLG